MIRVTEINSLRDLEGLRTVWGDLLNVTPGATFFQTHEWLQAFWQHYGVGDAAGRSAEISTSAASENGRSAGNEIAASGRPERLRVLLIEADGEPLGILPLLVSSEAYRVGTMRVLGYPLAGWGSFYGPIGPHPTATLRAGLDYIRSAPRDCASVR